MLSRRALVSKLAAGAAGAAVAWVASPGKANALSTRTERGTPPGSGNGGNRSAVAPEDLPAQAGRVAVIEAKAPAAADRGEVDAGPPETRTAAPPWELLRPLRKGSVVAHGWRVAELSGAVDGACVLTLRNPRGREHRIHLCRNDGRPQGLVYTERLDLMVMNGGQGDLPTEEGLAQAVAKVAHVLAANEGERQQARTVVALLPHAERLRQFDTVGGARLR